METPKEKKLIKEIMSYPGVVEVFSEHGNIERDRDDWWVFYGKGYSHCDNPGQHSEHEQTLEKCLEYVKISRKCECKECITETDSKFLIDKDANLCGTSLKGKFKAKYSELVAIFGKPNSRGDEYKVSTQWCFTDSSGKPASIYDYKETNFYDENLPTVEEFRSENKQQIWHIGTLNKEDADELLMFIFIKINNLHYELNEDEKRRNILDKIGPIYSRIFELKNSKTYSLKSEEKEISKLKRELKNLEYIYSHSNK